MKNNLKLSVFGTLQSYESKPLSLDTILWWIRQDKSVAEKTELYRNLARVVSPDEAKKKVKEAMMPAFSGIPISSRKVSLIMKKLGYRSERTHRGCFYRLYELKPDEQQSELAKDLSVEMAENQSVATEQDLPF